MKDSAITIKDLFCGAGGSSIGATKAIQAKGGKVAVAMNHWKLAIETHNTNFPDTMHDCTDIQACDPRRYPSTNILIASPECFPKGTLITTEKGLIPIEEVKIGDMVLTHKLRYMPVTETMKAIKDTIIVSGQGNRCLETTKEHPFYTVKQGRKWNNDKRQYERTFEEFEWTKAIELNNKTRWCTPNRYPHIDIPIIKGNNNRGIDFNNEFWWMVGRWLGDGCVRLRKKQSNEITIVCGKHEVDFMTKKLSSIISLKHASKNEIKWRKREIRTAFLFEATHDSLSSWIVSNFGKLAHHKEIPSWVLSMPIQWRYQLLEGYVSADGNRTERYTMISTVSKKLAFGIKALASTLDFHCSIGNYHHKSTILEGRELKAYDSWIVRWENNHSQRTGHKIGQISTTLIKSIEKGNSDVDVFNISVQDDESYIADGIIVHNCTNHSVAKGKKAVTAQLDLFDKGILDPACERSRATMWDVPRFAEYHKYEIVIVENVVDARKWIQFPAWLMSMDLLGYDHKCVYANSMHFQPTPQSRDRMYVVFWKKGNRKPNLELTPKANCQKCGCDVESVQAWKNSSKKFGKYKSQYVYVCPNCVSQVEPYYYAAFNVIDWSNIGTRIGDRKKPLSENTERRIRFGLEKYGKEPIFFHTAYGKEARGVVRNFNSPVFTQTTHQSMAMAVPYIIKGEHTLVDGMVKSSLDAMQTQCTRQTMSLVTPFIINTQQQTGVDFRVKSVANVVPTQSTGASLALALPYIVEMNSSGKAKPITNPTSTFTAGGVNHAVVTPESYKAFIHSHYGQTTLGNITDAIGTQTTKDRHSIVSYQEPKYEDCFYRMLFPREVQAAMAFESDYIVLGSGKDQVKQLGNAVTPPAMEWLVSRCVESLEN